MAKIAKPSELRGMPESELQQRLSESRQELATLRLKARQGATEQPHRIGQLRRDVARMLTVLHERTH